MRNYKHQSSDLGLGREGREERRGNTAIKAICFRIFYCTIKEEKILLLKIWQKGEKKDIKIYNNIQRKT
jgi:hypothetical protein